VAAARLDAAGGLGGARTTTSTVCLLDPGTGRVHATGRLATAVHDATGFALGGVPYVVAGGNETTYDVVQRVDTSENSHVAGRLSRPRSDLVSIAVGSTAYVLGGFDGTTSLPQVLRTTDGSHFT